MKARLLLFHEALYLLKRSGEINRVTEGVAREFLLNYVDEKYYGDADMLPYTVSDDDGTIIAEVDDSGRLIIEDHAKFKEIIINGETEYLSVREFAQLHGKGEVIVRRMCQQGRIPGVILKGTVYLIPSTSPYPTDKR